MQRPSAFRKCCQYDRFVSSHTHALGAANIILPSQAIMPGHAVSLLYLHCYVFVRSLSVRRPTLSLDISATITDLSQWDASFPTLENLATKYSPLNLVTVIFSSARTCNFGAHRLFTAVELRPAPQLEASGFRGRVMDGERKWAKQRWRQVMTREIRKGRRMERE